MKKLLLVQTGFIGDVILSTPVIENLSILFPEAKLSVLTTPKAAALIEHHPAVFETIIFDKRGEDSGVRGLFRMARRLREKQFSTVFSLHKSWRTALLLWLSRIPKRYGFLEASGQIFYSRTTTRAEYGHEVLRNLAILKLVGVAPEEATAPMKVYVPVEVSVAVSEKLEMLKTNEQGRVIGLAPGSVWATKRWPVEYYGELARSIVAQGDSVALIGGEEDALLGQVIETYVGVGRCLNFIGKLSLLESAALIGRLSALVSNDSAPLHLASAMNTPVVALFCATVPEFGFGPWRVSSKVLGVSGLGCRPCGRHGGNTCPTGTHACQKELTSETVLSALNDLLGRSQGIDERKNFSVARL